MCEEGLGDVGEEMGAVDGGDVYGVPAGIIFFGGDDYGRRNGDVADAAADVWAAALFLDGGIAVDEAVEFGFKCALAVGIFFGREIIGKLQDEGVEDVVVFVMKARAAWMSKRWLLKMRQRRAKRRSPLGMKTMT